MGTIISITSDTVTIRLTNGETRDFPRKEISFVPTVGEEVDVITFNGKTTFRKSSDKIYNNMNTQSELQPEGKWVNKTLYCVLALFLGGFGVHCFYAGKNKSGVIRILFSWTSIPSIIAFVEFIIALCQKSDHKGEIFIKK